jgi:hypothetical protein
MLCHVIPVPPPGVAVLCIGLRLPDRHRAPRTKCTAQRGLRTRCSSVRRTTSNDARHARVFFLPPLRGAAALLPGGCLPTPPEPWKRRRIGVSRDPRQEHRNRHSPSAGLTASVSTPGTRIIGPTVEERHARSAAGFGRLLRVRRRAPTLLPRPDDTAGGRAATLREALPETAGRGDAQRA